MDFYQINTRETKGAPGDYSAWDELVGTLYSVEERAKIEWAIGSVVSGDSKKIHKFFVFYGPPGSGKSTILNIIEKLFEGYTRLNSIVAHENMAMNEKYKPGYTARVNAILFMGTNQPVKISDAKSGLIRRLIDIHPTGVKIPINHYTSLMSKIDFEMGAIAYHCLEVYRKMGENYYNGYRPLEMMLQTDMNE